MAKYDINYSCGHSGVIVLQGKTSERERQIEWRESGVCPECYKAKKREEKIEMGLVYNIDIDTNVMKLFEDTEKIIRISFDGDTLTHKDNIKSIGGYTFGEIEPVGFLGFMSATHHVHSWYKHVTIDQLKSEIKRAESIGAKRGKYPNDTEVALARATIAEARKCNQKRKEEFDLKIASIEKPVPPAVWEKHIQGHKCNRKIYGRSGNYQVYADNEKIELTDEEAVELEKYWKAREKYEKAIDKIKSEIR